METTRREMIKASAAALVAGPILATTPSAQASSSPQAKVNELMSELPEGILLVSSDVPVGQYETMIGVWATRLCVEAGLTGPRFPKRVLYEHNLQYYLKNDVRWCAHYRPYPLSTRLGGVKVLWLEHLLHGNNVDPNGWHYDIASHRLYFKASKAQGSLLDGEQLPKAVTQYLERYKECGALHAWTMLSEKQAAASMYLGVSDHILGRGA